MSNKDFFIRPFSFPDLADAPGELPGNDEIKHFAFDLDHRGEIGMPEFKDFRDSLVESGPFEKREHEFLEEAAVWNRDEGSYLFGLLPHTRYDEIKRGDFPEEGPIVFGKKVEFRDDDLNAFAAVYIGESV